MVDKELFRLIGGNKKYIFIAVLLQAIDLIANVAITGSVCYAVYLLTENAEAMKFVYPLISAAAGIIVRYICSRATGDVKDKLGRSVKKNLRERVYNKIVKLGVKTTDGMSMAGLTQVSVEGVEQLDLYYSSYLPQFFFCDDRTRNIVLDMRMDRLENGSCTDCLCAAYPRVDSCREQVCKENLRKILGQIHLNGRQVS